MGIQAELLVYHYGVDTIDRGCILRDVEAGVRYTNLASKTQLCAMQHIHKVSLRHMLLMCMLYECG